MNLVVVICHFQEDLTWVKDLNYPYIVYNKNPKNNDKFELNFPNVGYDAIVYFDYIIKNYDNLPDFVCFTQDNPFDHCPSFLDKVNNFNTDLKYYPLGITYVRDGEDIINQSKEYAKINNIEVTMMIKFIAGTQSILSKELILNNPKEFYEKLQSTITKTEIVSHNNWMIEYLWPSMFGFNEELEITLYNC